MNIIKTLRSLVRSSESLSPAPREFIGRADKMDMSDDAIVRPHNRILSRRERILEWQSVVNKDIEHVKKDRRTHVYTCKPEDDRFLTETANVLRGMETTLATIEYRLERVDEEILEIINTFPADRPCTIDVIVEEIGIPRFIIDSILIEHETFDSSKKALQHLETVLPMFMPEYGRPERFKIARCIYTMTNSGFCGMSHYLKIMKHPNWRFVVSKDVTYLERAEL